MESKRRLYNKPLSSLANQWIMPSAERLFEKWLTGREAKLRGQLWNFCEALQLPSKLRFSANCLFFRQLFCLRHYPSIYQPSKGVYLLNIQRYASLKWSTCGLTRHGWVSPEQAWTTMMTHVLLGKSTDNAKPHSICFFVFVFCFLLLFFFFFNTKKCIWELKEALRDTLTRTVLCWPFSTTAN